MCITPVQQDGGLLQPPKILSAAGSGQLTAITVKLRHKK